MEGYSVRQLSQQSGRSRYKLSRIINYWLKEAPPATGSNLAQYQYLIFDGTFLHRPTSIVALMEADNHQVIDGRYKVSENSERQLLQYFTSLIAKGLKPRSCTVDGNPQAIKVIRQLWPGIIIQRCLVHIQRQGLMWCRRYPKTASARSLRRIFLRVTQISTRQKLDEFLEQLRSWEQEYGREIARRPERGRVFSDIKRARSMLIKALPDMFHYLEDSNISFTTNGLESYFSRLKSHYRQHRGLPKNKLAGYLSWYLFYKPK